MRIIASDGGGGGGGVGGVFMVLISVWTEVILGLHSVAREGPSCPPVRASVYSLHGLTSSG